MFKGTGEKVTRNLPPDTCSAVPMAWWRGPVGAMKVPLLSTCKCTGSKCAFQVASETIVSMHCNLTTTNRVCTR